MPPIATVLAPATLALALPVSPATSADAPTPAPRSCEAPEHPAFDSRIGAREVRSPDGTPAGTDRTERILDGRVSQGSWTGARGMRGRSFNLYSAADRRWHQTWVGSHGPLLAMTGGIENGATVLTGDTPLADGRRVAHRIPWQPLDDGRVRQRWETAADSGRTWQDAFVGLYRRKPQPGGSR